MADTTPTPNEQVRAYLETLKPGPPVWERDVAELRIEDHNGMLATGGEPEPVGVVQELDAGGVPARLYSPRGGERDVLVWMHGGAWMIGDLDGYDALVRALANRAGCAVLAVDYRLAPEHRYPAAIDDCWMATEWAMANFERVAVGGDSSGGNLAAAVALRARDRDAKLALQLLVYPVLDYRVDSPSYDRFTERYARFAGQEGAGDEDRQSIRYIWHQYVPDPARRNEQDASPFRAPSLRDIAPALLITAEHDILRGEDEDYAHRLRAEGVQAELVNYEGQIHGFFEMLGIMEDARDAVERSAAALRRAFSR